MWRNPQEIADLVTFTEEILNGKRRFFGAVCIQSVYNGPAHYVGTFFVQFFRNFTLSLYFNHIALFLCCTVFIFCYFQCTFFARVALFSCCTFFVLHLFMLHSFYVALFFVLHFLHVAFVTCCTFPYRTLSIFRYACHFLFFLRAVLLSCFTFFVLHSFCVALFTCYMFSVMHFFYVLLFPCCNFFCIALFSCYTFFMLLFSRVALFSCSFFSYCTILMLFFFVPLFSCCTVIRKFFSEQIFCRKLWSDCLFFMCTVNPVI